MGCGFCNIQERVVIEHGREMYRQGLFNTILHVNPSNISYSTAELLNVYWSSTIIYLNFRNIYTIPYLVLAIVMIH